MPNTQEFKDLCAKFAGEDAECPVCLRQVKEDKLTMIGEHKTVTNYDTECPHSFCGDCVDGLLSSGSKQCPMCRENLTMLGYNEDENDEKEESLDGWTNSDDHSDDEDDLCNETYDNGDYRDFRFQISQNRIESFSRRIQSQLERHQNECNENGESTYQLTDDILLNMTELAATRLIRDTYMTNIQTVDNVEEFKTELLSSFPIMKEWIFGYLKITDEHKYDTECEEHHLSHFELNGVY